ncbi:TPA: hypothetical protein N0F65_007587 [Lagenidium giganteum]|uniref:Transmembrane protein n=1 Tax=Lagenidium giganteum TaxID=4803 RepID=A0AAV2ZIZ6_9STRA|nr:TPA: hypothetical protein N0F65_007587 [Lagenidium giganteum]
MVQMTDDLHHWKTKHRFLGRYSVEKLQLFDRYQRDTSYARVFIVLIFAIVPSIAVVTMLFAIPLQDPNAGAPSNTISFVRSALTHSMSTAALMLVAHKSMGCPPVTKQDWAQIFTVSVSTGVMQELVWVGIAFVWRFPVPFRENLAVFPFIIFVSLFYKIFARDFLRRHRLQIKLYMPVLATQCTLVFTFLALAFVFASVSLWFQVVMVLVFPMVKLLLKHWSWERVRQLNDLSTDMTICFIEIASSVYQTVCMQHVNAPEVVGLLIAVDALQAVLEVRLHVIHPFIADGRSSIRTACNIVESSLFPGQTEGRRASLVAMVAPRSPSEDDIRSTIQSSVDADCAVQSRIQARTAGQVERLSSAKLAVSVALDSAALKVNRRNRYLNLLDLAQLSERETRSMSSEESIHEIPPPPSTSSPVVPLYQHDHDDPPSSSRLSDSGVRLLAQDDVTLHRFRPRQPSAVMIDGIMIQRKEQARILEQTLQLLFSCEVLLFVEFTEIVIPILYAILTTFLWHLPNAKFHLVLAEMSGADLVAMLRSCLLYSGLEVASFVAMAVLMHRRYGFSVLHQLAFVIEHYWMVLHGKLLGFVITSIDLAMVHHGAQHIVKFGGWHPS